jgi:hypothetical protein
VNLFPSIFRARPAPNPARELALIGASKRRKVSRAIVYAVAKRMREECGLPPAPALERRA